jgi:hypothetical protein
MAREIGAPVTAYVAKVYERGNKCHTIWVPIEQYSKELQYVPPGYNPLCALCRNTILESLLNHFEGNCRLEKCPLEFGKRGSCSGETAFCLSRDWNCCPAFLDARKKRRACYYSDTKLIEKVADEWTSSSYQGWSSHKCWLGLRELAFPAVVHDLLVAVLITGQFVLDPSELTSTDEIVERLGVRHSGEMKQRVSRVLEVLKGDRPQRAEERLAASFRLREADLEHISSFVRNSADRLEGAAYETYRNYRLRAESLFKKEILHQIALHKDDPSFLDRPLLDVLCRIREFWAFKAAYLLRWSQYAGAVCVVAYSGKDKSRSFGINRKKIGQVFVEYKELDPLYFLFDRHSGQYPLDECAAEVCTMLEMHYGDPSLALPTGRFYYCVIAFGPGAAYMLLFAVRDEDEISTLPARQRGGLSTICQESMFDTGVDILRSLAEVGVLRHCV